MAKMFYSLEETAEKLGCSEDQVKQMVEDGKLQQFRDRDSLMFKVDQVDKAAAARAAANEDSGEINLEDDLGGNAKAEESGTIDLSETNDSPAVDPAASASGMDLGATGTASGMSLGDTGETAGIVDSESADDDSSEKTQVSDSFSADASDISLDSIGSGSGLLDLTQESDDTSLGSVELLDDAPSGSGLGSGLGGGLDSDEKMGESSDALAGSSTGIFEAAGEESSPALPDASAGESDEEEDLEFAAAYESTDSADGFIGGMLAGVFVVLIIGALITLGGLTNTVTGLTTTFADAGFGMYYIILAVVCLVFGVIGMFISKR